MISAWTIERIELLRRMWADGYSCSLIAGALGGGITRNAVIGKAKRLNLTQHEKYRGHPDFKHKAHKPKGRRIVFHKPIPTNEHSLVPDVMADDYDNRPMPAAFLGIKFMDLQPSHCRYPRGEGAALLFCGQPKRDEMTSYCAACHRRCYGYRPLGLSNEERARRQQQGLVNYNIRRGAA